MFSPAIVEALEVFCKTRGIVVAPKNFNLITFVRELNKRTAELFTDIEKVENDLNALIIKHSLMKPAQGAYKLVISIDEDFNLSLGHTVGGATTHEVAEATINNEPLIVTNIEAVEETKVEVKKESPKQVTKAVEAKLQYTADEVIKLDKKALVAFAKVHNDKLKGVAISKTDTEDLRAIVLDVLFPNAEVLPPTEIEVPAINTKTVQDISTDDFVADISDTEELEDEIFEGLADLADNVDDDSDLVVDKDTFTLGELIDSMDDDELVELVSNTSGENDEDEQEEVPVEKVEAKKAPAKKEEPKPAKKAPAKKEVEEDDEFDFLSDFESMEELSDLAILEDPNIAENTDTSLEDEPDYFTKEDEPESREEKKMIERLTSPKKVSREEHRRTRLEALKALLPTYRKDPNMMTELCASDLILLCEILEVKTTATTDVDERLDLCWAKLKHLYPKKK